MDKKKSTGILLSILGVISLVLITAGVTYAFFTYAKTGETENTITTGTITFYYDELNQEGNGIKIVDAIPTSDTDGKVLLGNDQVFNFKVTATSTGNATIPYEVTARMKDTSTLDQDAIKLYLTEVADGTGTETAAALTVDGDNVKTFADLVQTTKVTEDVAIEKTIFNGVVPASSADYEQNFRLRMWLANDVDYTPFEYINDADNMITSAAYIALSDEEKAAYSPIAYVDAAGAAYTKAEYDALDDKTGLTATTQIYPINGKSFTVTVNVYANATVVTVPDAG